MAVLTVMNQYYIKYYIFIIIYNVKQLTLVTA